MKTSHVSKISADMHPRLPVGRVATVDAATHACIRRQ